MVPPPLFLLLLILCFVFLWLFICPFRVGSLSGVFSWADFFPLIPGSAASLSLCVLFGQYDEAPGFCFLGFVFASVMGPSRSSSLRIGDDSSPVAGSGRVRDASICSTAVEPQNVPGAPPLPLDKDKGKINLIKYPEGSDFLKLAVRHAVNVGSSKVGPSYGIVFAERYRPPPRCPNMDP